jgi:hypothetical protein
MEAIYIVGHICQKMETITSSSETIPCPTKSGGSFNTPTWTLRFDPSTPLPGDLNNGGILLSLITTPIVQDYVSTLHFELCE